MTEWLDPGTWASIAKTAATSVTALTRLRDALARRKKATHKGEDVDALRKDLERLVDLMLKQATSHGRFLEALFHLLKVLHDGDVVARAQQYATLVATLGAATTRLQDLALAHENRLKAIEQVLPTKVVGAKKQRRKPPRRATRRK
jgi:hypothetical protein